jgi:hypothetical protein
MPFGDRLVLIEFTQDTDKRKAGSRLRVDAGSATSFCDRQKVAKRVGNKTATPAPVQPEPVAVVADVKPEEIPPVDVDD